MAKVPRRTTIDRRKLRRALRKLGDEHIFYLLDEAIELLPPIKLADLIGRYVDVEQLRPGPAKNETLLDEVRAFDAASRAGSYYDRFDVNSTNRATKSIGTRAFIADCRRLLERCVREARDGDALEVRDAMTLILDLLRHIDECHDDVVFFADEGGSWQVGIDSMRVFSALFLCFSRTSGPDEYARRVIDSVSTLEDPERERLLATARRIGSRAHRQALRSPLLHR
jgi:hypothetical protein